MKLRSVNCLVISLKNFTELICATLTNNHDANGADEAFYVTSYKVKFRKKAVSTVVDYFFVEINP